MSKSSLYLYVNKENHVWNFARIAGVAGGSAYHATVVLHDYTLLTIGGKDGTTERSDVLTLRPDQIVPTTKQTVEIPMGKPEEPVKKKEIPTKMDMDVPSLLVKVNSLGTLTSAIEQEREIEGIQSEVKVEKWLFCV